MAYGSRWVHVSTLSLICEEDCMLTPFSEFNFEACMKEVDVAYYEELIKQYSVSDIGPGSEIAFGYHYGQPVKRKEA